MDPRTEQTVQVSPDHHSSPLSGTLEPDPLSLNEIAHLWNKAIAQYSNRETEASLTTYKRLLRQLISTSESITVAPQHEIVAKLWFNVGVINGFQGENWLAAQALTKSVDVDPELVLGWYALGIADYELGEYRRAQVEFGTALAIMESNDLKEVIVECIGMEPIASNAEEPKSAMTTWTLRRVRVDWNMRMAFAEKKWKAARVARPGEGAWGVNGLPVGVLFAPMKFMTSNTKATKDTADEEPQLNWYSLITNPGKKTELRYSQALETASNSSDESMLVNKPLPPLPISPIPVLSAHQTPMDLTEHSSDVSTKEIEKVKGKKRRTRRNTLSPASTGPSPTLRARGASDSTDILLPRLTFFDDDSGSEPNTSPLHKLGSSLPDSPTGGPLLPHEIMSTVYDSSGEDGCKPSQSSHIQVATPTVKFHDGGELGKGVSSTERVSKDRLFVVDLNGLEGNDEATKPSDSDQYSPNEIIDAYGSTEECPNDKEPFPEFIDDFPTHAEEIGNANVNDVPQFKDLLSLPPSSPFTQEFHKKRQSYYPPLTNVQSFVLEVNAARAIASAETHGWSPKCPWLPKISLPQRVIYEADLTARGYARVVDMKAIEEKIRAEKEKVLEAGGEILLPLAFKGFGNVEEKKAEGSESADGAVAVEEGKGK
ncbi:hypothetical protein MMC24_003116 [Lignoscripta atroalba]|nr:hypothetical protein [Lignoscripta atroalba]